MAMKKNAKKREAGFMDERPMEKGEARLAVVDVRNEQGSRSCHLLTIDCYGAIKGRFCLMTTAAKEIVGVALSQKLFSLPA